MIPVLEQVMDIRDLLTLGYPPDEYAKLKSAMDGLESGCSCAVFLGINICPGIHSVERKDIPATFNLIVWRNGKVLINRTA